MALKYLGAALKWLAPTRLGNGETRMAVSEATFSLEAGSGGNDAVRSPVFEEVSSMLLHRWIDELREEDLPSAQRALQPLRVTDSPVPLDDAPLDDEPDDDDFDGGLTEARADVQAGRVVSHEEVKRRWGIK